MVEIDLETRVVGKISSFHGVKGELKLSPLVNREDMDIFEALEEVIIDAKSYGLESIRFHGPSVLIKLQGFNDRDSVESFKSKLVEIDPNLLPGLAENEYYIDDLIGLDVCCDMGSLVGAVSAVNDSGQVSLVIEPEADLSLSKQIILPFVEEYILDIDLDEGVIMVNIPDALLELSE